jgi:hypothetical protein
MKFNFSFESLNEQCLPKLQQIKLFEIFGNSFETLTNFDDKQINKIDFTINPTESYLLNIPRL